MFKKEGYSFLNILKHTPNQFMHKTPFPGISSCHFKKDELYKEKMATSAIEDTGKQKASNQLIMGHKDLHN